MTRHSQSEKSDNQNLELPRTEASASDSIEY